MFAKEFKTVLLGCLPAEHLKEFASLGDQRGPQRKWGVAALRLSVLGVPLWAGEDPAQIPAPHWASGNAPSFFQVTQTVPGDPRTGR